MKPHKHQPVSYTARPWHRCIDPVRCRYRGPGAHGHVVMVEVCGCGAVREIEIHDKHTLEGQWQV